MSADHEHNCPLGFPLPPPAPFTPGQRRALALEQARGTACRRADLAASASTALTEIADDMGPSEAGFAEANAAALAVDRLVKTLRAQVPR